MTHADPLSDVVRSMLWLVVVSFLVGFAGVMVVAGPGAIRASEGPAELAAALDAADAGSQDS